MLNQTESEEGPVAKSLGELCISENRHFLSGMPGSKNCCPSSFRSVLLFLFRIAVRNEVWVTMAL